MNSQHNFRSDSNTERTPLLTSEQQQNPLSKKIEQEAELIDGLDPSWLEFPDILTPKEDEDGDMYVSDFHNIVRYYPRTKRLTISPEQVERQKIIAESERQMSLEAVMYELVHGSGNPFASPSSPDL